MTTREKGAPTGSGHTVSGKVAFKSARREAKELIRRHRHLLLGGVLLVLVGRVAGLVLPVSSQLLVDEVVLGRRTSLLFPLGLAALAGALVQSCTGYLVNMTLGIAALRAVADLRRRVEAQVLRLPVREFDRTQTGVLISRIMNDGDGLKNLIGAGLASLLGGALTGVAALVALLWLNWVLAIGVMAVFGLYFAGTSLAFIKLRPVHRERGRLNAELTGRLTEALGGIRVVKAYASERYEDFVFARGVNKVLRNFVVGTRGAVAVNNLLTPMTLGLIWTLIVLVGGHAVTRDQMSLGELMMFVMFTAMLASPLIQISQIGTQLAESFAGLDRIHEIGTLPTESAEDSDKRSITMVNGKVEFRNVWFEYMPGVPVLRGVSFIAAPETTTALVGSSGSGKSTILSLIMAFHFPTQGAVLLDGHDLSSVKRRDYRTYLGIVLQDNFLFDGTILDCIRYSRPHSDVKSIRRVAETAHCTEFIEKLPNGWNTIVGERGIRLSGGQRQRIAIARALLADPAILLLDEATSSLDSESEHYIQQGLKALRAGRTTFVIAHRLSTIMDADQILVLEEGNIVERGTHRALLSYAGRYSELHGKQYRREAERYVNPGEELAPTT